MTNGRKQILKQKPIFCSVAPCGRGAQKDVKSQEWELIIGARAPPAPT